MHAKTIVSSLPTDRFLSIQESFSKIKKKWLSTALLLSLAFFAAPATGQVSITTSSTLNSFATEVYTVTFSTAQTGLSASNFSVSGSITGAAISNITGSDTSYQVSIAIPNRFNVFGTVTLNMVNSDGLSPGFVLTDTISGPPIQFDSVNPTVSISAPSAGVVTSAGPGSVSYTVTYADGNFGGSNLTTAGITLNTTGSATGIVSLAGSGTSYTVTISGISGNGTLGISVAAGHASDLAGNTDAGAGPSAVVNIQLSAPPAISYGAPQFYTTGATITPITPISSGVAAIGSGTGYGTSVTIGSAASVPTVFPYKQLNSYGTSIGAGYQLTDTTKRYPALIKNYLSLSRYINYCVSGDQTVDQQREIFNTTITRDDNIISTVELAANEANRYTTTDQQANFKLFHLSAVAWLAIPAGNKFTGQSGTAVYTGTWKNSGLYGAVGKVSNTNGDRVSMSLSGTAIGVSYTELDGNGGTASIVVDGGPPVTLNAFGQAGSVIATNNGKTYGSALYLLTGLSNTTHTVVITVTSSTSTSNKFYFDWAGSNGNVYPVSGAPVVLVANCAQRFVQVDVPAISAIVDANTATLHAAGFNVYPVNIQNVLNLSTQIGPDGSHPNESGQYTLFLQFKKTIDSLNNAARYDSLASSGQGITVDAAGNLYVTNLPGTKLLEFPAGGGSTIDLSTGLIRPIGIAADASGNLYIADAGDGTVKKISTGGGSVTTFAPGLNAPNAIAIDASGNVYVTDVSNGTVKKIPAGGGNAAIIGSGFSSPQGIAVDGTGNVYVSDFNSTNLWKIPAGGGSQVLFSSGFSHPLGLAVDAAGNVYVADSANGSVKKISSGGGATTIIYQSSAQPDGVTIDAAGNVYFATITGTSVNELKPVAGYHLSNTLPAGLSMDGSTGVISGTPTAVTPAANYAITGYNGNGGTAATVNIQVSAPASISYAGTNVYLVNKAISPLFPLVTLSPATFATPASGSGMALDYNGNAYTISGAGNIILNPPGNGAQVTTYNGSNAVSTNIATASISATTSTIIFGAGSNISAMDYTNGFFQSPVNIVPEASTNLVAATHPVSGPEIAMIYEGNASQITFSTRTGGVWSAPSAIANAFTNTALAINTYQGGLKMAFVGLDSKLYYAINSGGVWSAVAPWATQNVDMTGTGAFAMDTQGDVWYCNGTSLKEFIPGATSPATLATLPSVPNAIAFDVSGNLYVNFGALIEELQLPGNFQVSPSLPAGLSINSTTGVISGIPGAPSPAANYTVTAAAGGSNITASVNIQTIPAPTLNYGDGQNYVLGTIITPISPTSNGITPQKYNSTPMIFANVTAPTGLAVDVAGNVYINQSDGVASIPVTGGTPTPLCTSQSGPITIDGTGNLYRPNSDTTLQYHFLMRPASSAVSAYTSGSFYNGFYIGSRGIAVDQAGNVYVAGASTNTVYEYTSGSPLNGQGNPIAIATGFSSVSGIAVDAAGNIYVADAGAGTVDVIPANRGQWTTLASGLGAPANLCIDGAGNLYFSDNSANTISEIQAGSNTPVLIASAPGLITALAIDGQGNLFAADNTNNVIDKFSPAGGYYINPVLPAGLSFNGSTGVISGTPTAASAAANYTIAAYNQLSSASATQYIAVTAAPPTLSYGGALSFNVGKTIVPLTPNSSGVAAQGYNTVPSFIDQQFGAPRGVAVDTSLNVYVADPYNFANHSLNVNSGGSNNFANWVFPKGKGQGFAFLNPNSQVASVAIDSVGNLYSDEFNLGRISKLTPYPALTENVLITNTTFFGLATDTQGNLFGAFGNSLAHIIPSGIFILAGEFSNLAGIAIDGSGNVYLSDAGAGTLYKLPAGSSVPILAIGGLNAPGQLAADGTGNIFIADGGNGVIKELPAGAGATTTVLSGLKTPNGVAVDINGALYVAEATLGQVRKYAPIGGYYISPALPPGLSFNNTTGVINGTPNTVTPVKDYKITAYNLSGGTQTILRFGVTPPNFNLTGLTVSTGSLNPAFATDITGYSVSLPYASSQIAVTPTTADGDATVTVNGTVVTSGSASGLIALNVGVNTITIIVTASDNFSTRAYTVTVIRAAPSNNAQVSTVGLGYTTDGLGNTYAIVTPIAAGDGATVTVNGNAVASGAPSGPILLSPGSNTVVITVTAQDGVTQLTCNITVMGPLSGISTLSGLTISAGTLSGAFFSATTDYTDQVKGAITSVTVTPTTTDPNATVTVNGTTVNSGTSSGSISLAVGDTAISTVVTAQDGITTTTYTITITRLSNDAGLSTLSTSSGTLSPVFATDTTSYAASVSNATTAIAVTPTATYAGATVQVNGNTVTSGTASASIPLNVGANIINTAVTAQDGTITKTYTVTVTRLPSNDAALSELTVSTGVLSPVFGTATVSYADTVSNTTASITVSPTVNNPNATVQVNGTTIVSGTASGSIPLSIGANIITTVVTAQDGITTSTYTITIIRTPSNDASLSAFTISRGGLAMGFAVNTTSYADTVSNTTTAVTVTPTANNLNATILVNGTTVTSGTTSASQALVAGANVITVIVTAQDGITTKSYTVTVVRLPNIPTDASLTGLSVSNGTLTPAFASATTAYKDTVSNATTSITVTPTIANIGETVKVNGVTVNSGAASGAIALNTGNNTISIVVIAANGVTKKTYTVIVNRISNNAYLSNLTLSSGTLSPVFAQATGSYTASVSNATVSVMVTPTFANTNAIVKVNGVLVASGTASATIPLAVGTNTITVVVTAQDGVTKKTYTLVVTRAVGDATLSNLTVGSGVLNPVFDAGTISYTTSVSNATASITVTPTVNNPSATVKVNGAAVSSGTASAAIPLAVGTNTITVTVTAQDGITKKTYTVVVTRAVGDANLSNLAISRGALSPVFSSAITSYTAYVTNATASITITPTLNNPASTVKVNNTLVTSGTASAPIALAVGNTTINMVVTASDGVTRKTFAIVVTRPSNNAYLTNLTISDGTLSPVFLTATGAYTTTLSNATASVTVIPTLNNPHATITVNGTPLASGATSQAIPLAVGNTTINTVVTAQDGITKKNYTIVVTRVSNNAYLSNLTISSGTLSPVFAQVTGGYTASVSNSTTTVTVTPTLNNPHGSLTVNGTTVASGVASSSIPLSVGSNTLTVVVTAQDGVSHKTYKITVNRASGSLNSLYLPGDNEQTPLVSSLNEKVEANNILSPNGDGINDIWVVKNIVFYPDNTVTVYNRAGEVVFTKKGYANDWDGTYRGSVLSEGTYYYLVDLGNGKNVKGFITVVSH